MSKVPTALIEGQKLSVVLEYSSGVDDIGITDIIELTGPSQQLDPEARTIKILGLREGKLVTLIDRTLVAFERAESSLDPMLTMKLLSYMLEGKTFHTER